MFLLVFLVFSDAQMLFLFCFHPSSRSRSGQLPRVYSIYIYIVPSLSTALYLSGYPGMSIFGCAVLWSMAQTQHIQALWACGFGCLTT